MNWKLFAILAVLLLTCPVLTSNTDQHTPHINYLAHQLKNGELFQELDVSQITPHGNQSIIDISNPHFQNNQHVHIIIQLKNHTILRHSVIYNHDRPRVTLDIGRTQIKTINITNGQKIDSIQKKLRIMQTIVTDSFFLTQVMYVFQVGLSVSRNLILIGLVLNLLDTFLPFIIICQSFMMFGFFNADEHYLNVFFYNIFNSKLDIINAIRLGVSPGSDSNTLPMLSQYNFASNMFYNIFGEFVISIILLGLTVIISVSAAFCNSERFRTTKTKLRPLWNGFFISILPRLATFTGFHFRIITNNQVNIFFAIVFSILFAFYFIQLLMHIRRINQKRQYIEEGKHQIGLASRINQNLKFEFDCLHYPMLYYPVMNYLRLLLFFIPIGAAYDLYYLSFGGPIVSLLFMLMIEVSSPAYFNKRDRFLYPLNNFLLINMELCVITVALAQSVAHPQVSQIAEIVLFGIAIFVFVSSLAGATLDTLIVCKDRYCVESQKEEQIEQMSTQKFVKKGGKLPSDLDDNVHRTQDMDDFQEEELQDYKSGYTNQTYRKSPLKIKKVKRGKII